MGDNSKRNAAMMTFVVRGSFMTYKCNVALSALKGVRDMFGYRE